MSIDTVCYVCGKEGLFVNGLCYDCTMNEFRNPGAAFAATFGALCPPVDKDEQKPDETSDDARPSGAGSEGSR